MPKVWVVKAAHHNFNDATRFGDLCYIFTDNSDHRDNPEGVAPPTKVSPFQIDKVSLAVRQLIADGFVSADDFLLMSGPASMIAATYAEWLWALGEVKVLLFHARAGEYVLRTVRGHGDGQLDSRYEANADGANEGGHGAHANR